jgi:hypothetical protein
MAKPVTKPSKQVTVSLNGKRGSKQGEGFVLCPLGLQYYAKKPVAEFTVMDFQLSADQTKTGHAIACQGVVVSCQRQTSPSRYKVWIKFLDLPEKDREQIRCTAKKGKFICSYCANF